jgi:DNA modification methylase
MSSRNSKIQLRRELELSMPDTATTLGIVRVPIDRLIPDPANARKHGEENLEAIAASLRRFGQTEPLIVQEGTERVIAGNGRLAAMKKLGWTETDVVYLRIDDLSATALAIAMNRTAELAEWDNETLGRLLCELREEHSLDGVGFDHRQIDDLLAELADANMGDPIEDVPPEPLEDPVSARGDIWTLGNHRLMCGDSGNNGDLERLLDGARIQLVNTDPPYNVKVEPRSNNAIAAGLSSFQATHHQRFDAERNPGSRKATGKMRPKDRPLQNDFVSDEEFERLLLAWFGNLAYAMEPGAAFYIWGGYANVANYPPALAASGLYMSQAVIWIKGHPVLTRKDFMGNHEWCFYGWREGAGHKFYGPNNVTDVWEVQKVNPQSMIHLTEKPVELAVRAIEYSSKRGENVLDLFGGSGSTLMGCEHTGRRGFLMEIDPAYTDVIVRRWQKATGKSATLSGKSFAEVASARGKEVGES